MSSSATVPRSSDNFLLRIGQFNALNLALEDTYFHSGSSYTKDMVGKKVEWIARQLKKMRAGVIGFQEIFSPQVLKRCVDQAGIYERAHIICADNGSDAAVALVSAYPIVEKGSVRDFPKQSLLHFDSHTLPVRKFTRPVLRAVIRLPVNQQQQNVNLDVNQLQQNVNVDVQQQQNVDVNLSVKQPNVNVNQLQPNPNMNVDVNQQEQQLDENVKQPNANMLVTVFVMHAKSKRPVVSEAQRHDPKRKAVGHALSLTVRAAEAAALRCLLVEEMVKNPGRPVVLIGDLNDTVHSVTTEIISGTKPWKKLAREEKQRVWDVLLHSTNEIQVRRSDRDVTFTHIHNGQYDVLDHIMVSKEFCRTFCNHVGYVQYVSIFNDHLVDETLLDEPRDNIASDHGQVVVQIKIRKQQNLQLLAKQQAKCEQDADEDLL